MRFRRLAASTFFVLIVHGVLAFAQAEMQASPLPAATATVPRLIRITGTLRDAARQPLTGGLRVTFTLYSDETDPVGVWQEIQNVQLDSTGHYSVLLGSASQDGLPVDIFYSGQARWLSVHPDGQQEQPRILLLSVAYALKAADSDMLGGLPASAFVLAETHGSSSQQDSSAPVNSARLQLGQQVVTSGSGALPLLLPPPASCSSVTSDGTATANQLSKFTSACNIQNSAIFESGGNVGIGNTSPAGALDVSGNTFIRGSLNVLQGTVQAPLGTATTSKGWPSSPLDLEASVYNTTVPGPVNYLFRWQTAALGNDTANASANLGLLFGVNGLLLQTGLSIDRNGIVTFAPGQTFPGQGTVTSVATGAGLTGGPITKTGTISIPAGGVTNAMLASPSITVKAGSGLSGGGTVALGGTVTLTNSAPSTGGTVTSIATGAGLTGGPITTSGTLSLNTTFTDARYLRLSGGALTGGLTGTTAAFTGNLNASSATFTAGLTAAGGVMPAKGTATATQGFPSSALDFVASSFNSSTSKAISEDFRWQALSLGNNSSNPSAALSLLFGANGSAPGPTGFSIASNGRLTFAPGQTFPGAGTITQVTAGSGLTGGGSSGNVTLGLLTGCSPGQTLLWNGTRWICGSFGSVSGVAGGIAYFSSPTTVTSTPAATNGQIPIGATGSAPSLATLTAGPNITITNAPGSVTISAAGPAALPFFATGGGRADASQTAVKNVTALWGFLLPYDVTTTAVTYDITTADNTANIYDIGIFSSSGTLLLNIGPTAGTTFAPSTAFKTLSWIQGSTNLVAARYYLGFTTNCSAGCATIGATNSYVSFAVNVPAGASAGGALPPSVTPPSDAWKAGINPTLVIH